MANILVNPFYLLSPLIALVIGVLLLVIVTIRSRRSVRDVIFCSFLLCMTVWSFTVFKMRNAPDINGALPWSRIAIPFMLFMPVLFFYFSLTYYQEKLGDRRIVKILSLYLVAIIIVGSANLLVKGMGLAAYGYYTITRITLYPFLAISIIIMAAGIYNLSKIYSTSVISDERNRLLYVIIGAVGLLIGAILDVVPSIPPTGIWGNLIFATITAIAILRYHLLDVRLVIRKGLAYIGTTGLLISLFGLVLFGTSQFLVRVLGIIFWQNTLILLFVALALYPLFRITQGNVDRWFYREKYDHLKTIERFSEEIKSTMDLNLLVSSLLDVVTSVLKSERACLLLPDSTGKHLVVAASRGVEKPSAAELSQNSMIVQWVMKNDILLNWKDIEINPQLQALTMQERTIMNEVKMELLIPLKNRDRLSGIMMLGPKLSEQKYSIDDMMMLKVVAQQASISLDNARLFKEVEDSLLELKRMQEQIVRSERSTALGEMAAGVAHDFNNILAAILGRAQLALDDVTDERARKGLKIIEQAALDGAKTVRRLQDFTRVRADHHFEPVDLDEVVNKALQFVEPRLKEFREAKGKVIDLDLSLEQVESVMGDQGELVETLVNVLNNGIDAIPGNGRLGVSTRQENNYVVVVVSDTGMGIPDNIKDKIGDPYVSTKGPLGMGLGLSVAYGIINRHGGSIDFNSTVGEGTTFYIKLPIVSKEKINQSAVQTTEKHSTNVNRVVKKVKILIVEDDERIRENLQTMLLQLGHEVTIAENGNRGISKFNEGDYDLVITDLGMPNVSGWEVAKAVKRQLSSVPVIMITGWGVQLDSEKAYREGVDEVLTKPFTREGLYESIERLLGKADHLTV